MASQEQIDANRRNAARSTGPKTPEGKAVVSRNSIRHGLASTRAIALPEENLEEFNALFESLSAQFQPQSPFECSLLQQMAVADWRMRRAVRLETGILAYRLDELRGEQGIARLFGQCEGPPEVFGRPVILSAECLRASHFSVDPGQMANGRGSLVGFQEIVHDPVFCVPALQRPAEREQIHFNLAHARAVAKDPRQAE